MGRDRGRLWITTAGRNEELEKQMEERFKLLANSMTPIPSAIQPIFNPVHKEMLRTCPFEDEWDLYTKPLLTTDEIRKMLGLEPKKTVLYVELKRRKNSRVTQDQLEWIADLVAQGYVAAVCRGCDEAISLITDYLREKE